MKVGILHTADAHKPVFEKLLRDARADIEVRHEVDTSLLDQAMAFGLDHVREAVEEKLKALAAHGCEAIACTCSTIGPVAEGMVIEGIPVQRIDRAAADYLMRFNRVLVLAAIESAAEAADTLLEESAANSESSPSWLVALVPNAWQFFLEDDLDAYHASIVNFVNELADEYDAVFLSQASMMGAAGDCRHAHVVTTPELGVRRLVGSLASKANEGEYRVK